MSIPEQLLRDALAAVTNEKTVLAKDLHWDMRQPCADCPFLKTSPFHQGVAKSIPAVHRSIESNSFAHSCHKTDTRDQCDGPIAGQEQSKPVQHCAGALMMILKTGKGADLQLPLLQAMERGAISADDVRALTKQAKADKRVFTVRGLISFYLNKVKLLPGKDDVE